MKKAVWKRSAASGAGVRLTIGVVSFLAVATAGASVAADITIIAPPEKAVVESRIVSITVTTSERAVDEITIAVNGRETLLRKMPPGQSHLCTGGIKLAPGENAITVTGKKGGKKTGTQHLTLFYRTDLSAPDPPGDFSRYIFHGGRQEEGCRPCHQTTFRKTSENPGLPSDSPCFTCHRSLTAGYKFTHGATAVWSCMACHQISADGTLPADDSSCARCHDDSIKEWKKLTHQHGPAEAGKCTTCHNPHASDDASFLRLPPSDLCRSCHEETAARPHVISTRKGGHPTFLSPNPFQPSGDFSCISCHDPHGGTVPLFLRTGKTGMDFCRTCHLF